MMKARLRLSRTTRVTHHLTLQAAVVLAPQRKRKPSKNLHNNLLPLHQKVHIRKDLIRGVIKLKRRGYRKCIFESIS